MALCSDALYKGFLAIAASLHKAANAQLHLVNLLENPNPVVRLGAMFHPERSCNPVLAPFIALTISLGVFAFSGCTVQRAFKEGYEKGVKEANEEYLRTELATIREAIKKFTDEKGAPPISLDELVHAQYLSMIPHDPVTNKTDWVPVYMTVRIQKTVSMALKMFTVLHKNDQA